MEKEKLLKLIKTVNRAEILVNVTDTAFTFLSFNNHFTIAKYNLYLEDLHNMVYVEHLTNFGDMNSNDLPEYRNGLTNQFTQFFSSYLVTDGLYTHKRIRISDINDNHYNYEKLPLEIKQTISSFLLANKDAMIRFIDLLRSNHTEQSTELVTETVETYRYNPTGKKKIYPDVKLPDGDYLLDNEDVCRLLKISKRTLQYYRDTGKLPFTKFGSKFYYKLSDILAIINNNYKQSRE